MIGHRVYLTFFLRSGWNLQFLEADLKTPLPRRFTYPDPEPIRELARRAGAPATVEAEQQLDREIENGRGGMYLWLTPQQYAKLNVPRI
jgi:hypothetical protein